MTGTKWAHCPWIFRTKLCLSGQCPGSGLSSHTLWEHLLWWYPHQAFEIYKVRTPGTPPPVCASVASIQSSKEGRKQARYLLHFHGSREWFCPLLLRMVNIGKEYDRPSFWTHSLWSLILSPTVLPQRLWKDCLFCPPRYWKELAFSSSQSWGFNFWFPELIETCSFCFSYLTAPFQEKTWI